MKIDTTLNYGYYEKLRIVERLKRENKSDEKICSKLNIKKSELDNLVSQNQEVKDNFNLEKNGVLMVVQIMKMKSFQITTSQD